MNQEDAPTEDQHRSMLLSNQNSNSHQKELTSNEAEQSPQQKLEVEKQALILEISRLSTDLTALRACHTKYLCSNCVFRWISRACMPCAHACLCSSCTATSCPICEKPVESFLDFVSPEVKNAWRF